MAVDKGKESIGILAPNQIDQRELLALVLLPTLPHTTF